MSDSAFWELWASYERSLTAENRSKETLRTYRASAEKFVAFSPVTDPFLVTIDHVRRFVSSELENSKPATARIRFSALRGFFRWLVDEGEIPASPMDRMRPPTVPDQPTAIPQKDVISALLAVTAGQEFQERRDRAMIRVMFDTGLRRAELASLRRSDVDLDGRTLTVTSKGGHTDVVPFGTRAAQEIDRYLRLRARHAFAHRPELWVGHHGGLKPNAVNQMLRRRCEEAGIPPIHPHQLRHFFADAWKSSGGSEEDLQRIGRWRDPKMLKRYGAANADRRARAAHAALSPGDNF